MSYSVSTENVLPCTNVVHGQKILSEMSEKLNNITVLNINYDILKEFLF